jgi:hypothetical protein
MHARTKGIDHLHGCIMHCGTFRYGSFWKNGLNPGAVDRNQLSIACRDVRSASVGTSTPFK